MSGIGKYKKRKITCIANNSERYITFSLGGLRFIDSLQFMNASLERLVDNLTKDKFKFLHKFIDGPQQQELLLRKGVYPYDYVDGPAKLEGTQLPPKKNKSSTASFTRKALAMKTTNTRKMSGGPSTVKPLETTMMST